jgi:polyphenol oxidase
MQMITSLTSKPSDLELPSLFWETFNPQVIPYLQVPSPSTPYAWRPKVSVFYTLHTPLEGFRLKSYHSAVVVPAQDPPPSADGHYILGNTSALLTLNTADCLPVGFSASFHNNLHLIGLLHAGWRGYTQGILHRALERFSEDLKAHGVGLEELKENLSVFIGPGIFGSSYVCRQDVAQALEQHKNFLKKTYPSPFLPLEPLFEQGCNVKKKSEKEGDIYPDLQVLAVCDCRAWGIKPEAIVLHRENTYGHPVLPSFRYANHTLRQSADLRLVTHIRLIFEQNI